jgi:hypothetical protein
LPEQLVIPLAPALTTPMIVIVVTKLLLVFISYFR